MNQGNCLICSKKCVKSGKTKASFTDRIYRTTYKVPFEK